MRNRWIFASFLIVSAIPLAAATQPERAPQADLRAMTYNIRLDTPVDGDHQWSARRAPLVSQIELVRPDIIGFQEVLLNQRRDLEQALPRYARIGGGRDDGNDLGEAAPLFIDKDRLAVGASGLFWLSPTPLKSSKGWDAAYPRIAVWAQVRRLSDDARLLVINTHLDNEGLEARLESARMLRSWISRHRRKGEAVVLLGDFNAGLGEASLRALLDPKGNGPALVDSRAASRTKPAGTSITFNGFTPIPKVGETIDHIFVSKDVVVLRYHALAEQFDGRVASDHFPVVADLSLPSRTKPKTPPRR